MRGREGGGQDRGLVTLFIVASVLTVMAFVAALEQKAGSSNTDPAGAPLLGSSTRFDGASPSMPKGTAASKPSRPPTTDAPVGAGTPCGPNPLAHVYQPDRLTMLNPCVTVSGTIVEIRPQADGDYHILVQLDVGQTCGGLDCLDNGNRELQQGDLVVEAVCEHPVTQQQAVATCSQYHNDLPIPAVGTHVTVTGPWVYDTHGWNEIHPVLSFGS
jgi:hypothetical protein